MESNFFLTPPTPPPPFHKKIPWSSPGMMPSRCFKWKLLSYGVFFLHAVDGVQVEPMVSRETRPQHQVKGSFHCVAWKYGMNFILGIGSLLCILLEQYFPVYPYPFDILVDGEKHSTTTCPSLGPKPVKLVVTLPTIGLLDLSWKEGVGVGFIMISNSVKGHNISLLSLSFITCFNRQRMDHQEYKMGK